MEPPALSRTQTAPRARPGPSPHKSVSVSTTSSSAPYSTRRSSASKRGVFVSDRRLADLAADTEAYIQWREILSRTTPDGAADRAQWKWIEDINGFSIYSKQESNKFAVLAVGVLHSSVPEVVRVLHTPDAEKYLSNIESLYGDEFRDGAFVHRVNLRRLDAEDDDDDDETRPRHPRDLMDLTVKSAIFNKSSGWLHHHEKWSFVEASYRRQGGKSFEKLTTTLSPKEVIASKRRASGSPSLFSRSSRDSVSVGDSTSNSGRTRTFHDVTTAFSVQPEEYDDDNNGSGSQVSRPWKETRVFFYGEFMPPTRYGHSSVSMSHRSALSSGKTIKNRLVAMARSCERLTTLVRRHRLGVQVLADRKMLSLFTSPSRRCVCCNKSIVLLSIKQCRICGQGVCTECSQKHERETRIHGSNRMLHEDIRVCDRCMDRVDRSDYSELHDKSLFGPAVFPNGPDEPEASEVLKDLLKNELLNADTDARKVSVMNVIKCVLDQEEASVPPSPATSVTSITSSLRRGKSKSSGAVLLSTTSILHEADFVDALDQLTIKQVPYNEAELSTDDGRSYLIDSSNPDKQMAFPMPENEDERLRAMEEVKVRELINNSDELNIICELAAKEMDTFASMVTIVTPDEQQVVASNLDELQKATFPRAEAFCSHTIMDDRPILIPHPEADVRFHQCEPVKDLGIRYYCGFPIKNKDDRVIGALCCINKSTLDMTETQFNAMQKLAQTASKVIQVQGKQPRHRTASSMSASK